MEENAIDKCPVCGNDSFFYGKIDRLTRFCACKKCGVLKITEKCKKETEERFEKALNILENGNV